MRKNLHLLGSMALLFFSFPLHASHILGKTLLMPLFYAQYGCWSQASLPFYQSTSHQNVGLQLTFDFLLKNWAENWKNTDIEFYRSDDTQKEYISSFIDHHQALIGLEDRSPDPYLLSILPENGLIIHQKS